MGAFSRVLPGTIWNMNASDLTDNAVDFLIIGAGLAGLAFARDAHEAGKTVCVLDKGRGVGGRMATRRFAGGRVDHGAQFFTARGPRFSKLVDSFVADNVAREWSRGFSKYENGAMQTRPPGHIRYACPQGMSDFAKTLARGINVQTEAQAAQIEKVGDDTNGNFVYRVTCADGRVFAGHSLLLCLPPLQLLSLARPLLSDETATRLDNVTYDPAWTLMLHLEADLPGANWPAIEFDHPVLGWVSRDNTKRGPGAPVVLVVHGSGKWSAAHLEDNKADVQTALINALTDVFGPLPTVLEAQTHRWRYANPTHLLGAPFFWDTQTRIGGAGDWVGGGNVEGAVTSGWELAASVL